MRPQRKRDAVSRDLGAGETVILAGEERAIVLNPVASAVWHLVDGQRDIDEIAAIIAEHYPDTGIEQVRADVLALVRQMVEQDVLVDD